MYPEVNPGFMEQDVRVPVERLTPERRRDLTRSALIQAAAEIFALQGFHAASLEEIADAAGFTRGAIYSNFEGKEDLLLAVLEHYNDRQLQAFAGALDLSGELTTSERAEVAAAVWRQMVHRDRTLLLLSLELRMYALRHPEFRPRLAESHRRQEERVAELIAHEAASQGVALSIEPGDLAVLAWAASEGLQQLAGVDEEDPDRYDRLAETFFRILGEATLAPPVSRPETT
jgi:AcrR family transcriptional regulator